jgi:HEAT repeat protein
MRHIVKYLRQLFLIEEDEAGTVSYFLVFLIVAGFSMALGNATANTLFLKRFGIDYLPLMYLLQGSACFVTSLVYISIADVIPAERFFKIFFALLAAVVLTFWILISKDTNPLIFPAYFLFYEVIVDVLLTHIALYLNQNMNTLQAKRLSPIIFSGQQFGVILGGLFLAVYAPVLGTENILVVWFILILLSLTLVAIRHRIKGSSPYFRPTRKSAHKLQHMTTQIKQGFRFAITSELLRYSTIAMVFMVITYYIISYSVKSVYTESYALEEDLTAFFGTLAIFTSGLALVAQLLFTNRLIQRFGVPAMNLLFPMVSLVSFAGMIFHMGMSTAIVGSLNIKAVMPAIHNPVRTMFLNVLPQQIQGRARAMAIAIVLPVSLLACGILLWFLQKLNDPIYYLIPGITAAGLFFYYSIRMNRAYGKTLLLHLKEHLFLPEAQTAASLRLTGKDNLESIVDAISRGKESSVSLAKILTDAYPEVAAEHILPAIECATPEVADQLLKVVSTTNDPAVYSFLIENPNLHDNHFQATALAELITSRTEKAIPLLRRALDKPDPRIRAIGIHGIVSWPLVKLRDQAVDQWIALINGSENEQLAAIELIKDTKYLVEPKIREKITQACLTSSTRLFRSQTSAGKVNILNAYRYWQGQCGPEFRELVSDAMQHTDAEVRAAAVQCAHLFPEDLYLDKLESALGDGHARVRSAAVNVLHKDKLDVLQLAVQWILEDNRGSPRAQKTLLNAVIDTIPLGTLELIINNKIEDARQIHSALVSLRGHTDDRNRTLKLLNHVLEERFQQILEITLAAMEPMCAPRVISIIQAGIKTLDDRYMANACEALYSIPNRKLTQQLGQLIQDAFMPKRETAVSSTGEVEAVLESLSMRPDRWLQECARSALLSFKGNSNHG